MMKKCFMILILFCGCSPMGGIIPEEPVEVEPTFSENPIYNFKTRIDEGWELGVYQGKLIFIRRNKDGIETYRPIK